MIAVVQASLAIPVVPILTTHNLGHFVLVFKGNTLYEDPVRSRRATQRIP